MHFLPESRKLMEIDAGLTVKELPRASATLVLFIFPQFLVGYLAIDYFSSWICTLVFLLHFLFGRALRTWKLLTVLLMSLSALLLLSLCEIFRFGVAHVYRLLLVIVEQWDRRHTEKYLWWLGAWISTASWVYRRFIGHIKTSDLDWWILRTVYEWGTCNRYRRKNGINQCLVVLSNFL